MTLAPWWRHSIDPLPFVPFMFLKRLLYYLNPATLFGRSGNDVNLRFMHGINRISIFMFLICLVVLALRACMR
jgi:hypothetical protein